MRLIYLGSPAFAVPPLEALISAGHDVAAVITQPDRPAGRSRDPVPPPVKVAAERHGIPVIQAESLRDPAILAEIAALKPEVGVVAAYGELLSRKFLAIPPLGYVNIHPSLLPLHRGPAPVVGALLAGDQEIGVTVMRISMKMDSGPILAQAVIDTPPDARAGPLYDQLFQLGARMLVEVLPLYASGQLTLRQQDDGQASYTKMLSREDGKIDWSLPALVIERMTRAYDPWPGTFTLWKGQPLKIFAAGVIADNPSAAQPGQVIAIDGVPQVATGSGYLELRSVQPAGKRPMSGADWLRGNRDAVGAVLGE